MTISYSEAAAPLLEKMPDSKTTHRLTVGRMTTAQAAEYIGLPAATLRFWRHRGDIGPASYTLGGKKVMYDVADIDSWLIEQKKATLRGGIG